MGYYCTVEGCRGNHASKYELCIEPAKATREPTLDEQMAAIDHLRQCWMPETNPTLDAILASLERLKVLERVAASVLLDEPHEVHDISPVIQPRLEWHIATLEATPERARSIVQNETLAMLHELKAAREVGGVMLYELHYHMGCDQRCEKTYHPHFHASNSLRNNLP